MSELESLRPGQRAILRALAEPRSSYGDVATRLGTTPEAVRRVAREALEDIAGRPDALWTRSGAGGSRTSPSARPRRVSAPPP